MVGTATPSDSEKSTKLIVESFHVWLVEYDVDALAHHCLQIVPSDSENEHRLDG
jgi:hypothetical protein